MNMLRMVMVLQTEPVQAVQQHAKEFDASRNCCCTATRPAPVCALNDETRPARRHPTPTGPVAAPVAQGAGAPAGTQALAQADHFVSEAPVCGKPLSSRLRAGRAGCTCFSCA